MSIFGSRLSLVIVSVVAGMALAGGAAVAMTNPRASVISACENRKSGALRVVARGVPCKATEAPLSWNKRGLQGPAGPATATDRYSTPGTYTFTAPPGIQSLVVEVWAAGGGGGGGGGGICGDPTNDNTGYGGGQGGYVRAIVPTTPGQSFTVTVGSGGAGGSGGAASPCGTSSGLDGTSGSTGGSSTFGSFVTTVGGGGGQCGVGVNAGDGTCRDRSGAGTGGAGTATTPATPVTLQVGASAVGGTTLQEGVGGGVDGYIGAGGTGGASGDCCANPSPGAAGVSGMSGSDGLVLITPST